MIQECCTGEAHELPNFAHQRIHTFTKDAVDSLAIRGLDKDDWYCVGLDSQCGQSGRGVDDF